MAKSPSQADRTAEGAELIVSQLDLTRFTADIVSAYVAKNSVKSEELPSLIRDVAGALQNVDSTTASDKLQPAVPIKRSVKPDAIICLICGSSQKMLKRHLASAHGLTIDEYREMWNLPSTYPMVAPNYSKARATMAKKIGLGTKTTKRRGKRKS
ncbi:MucR family transcriptional regulator [bacterium]|nr:MucR family transcriptional regulator [bacterium]